MTDFWNTYLILWIIAMLWICHCLRMESQISFIFFLAIGLYASYSSRRTFFPSKLSLVIPSKINFSQIILGNMFQNKKIEKSSIWTKNLAKPSLSLFHFDHEWILCRLKIKVISLHEKHFDCQCISKNILVSIFSLFQVCLLLSCNGLAEELLTYDHLSLPF